jgi:hypothetical protein
MSNKIALNSKEEEDCKPQRIETHRHSTEQTHTTLHAALNPNRQHTHISDGLETMATAKLLSLCLLLVVRATTATSAAAAGHRTGGSRRCLGSTTTTTTTPGDHRLCRAADGGVLQLLTARQVRISKACCSVRERIGDRCVAAAFSSFPFNPTYPHLVKEWRLRTHRVRLMNNEK